MIQKFKRPISILLALLMVAGIFTALPLTVSAAEGDKIVFFTDSGNWNNVNIYAWDSEGAQTNGNNWPGPHMGYLFNNSDGQKVFGAIVSSSTVGVIFSEEGNPQSSDLEGFQDGDWWWWNGNAGNAVQVDRNDYEVVAAQAPTANSDGHKKYYKLGNWYVDENLTPSQSAAFITIPATGVAQVGDTKYESIAAAVEAASDGDTITILKDCAVTNQIDIDKNITIDGNDKTITCSFTETYAENGTWANGAAFQLVGDNRTFAINDATLDGAGGGSVAINAYRSNTNSGNVITLNYVTVQNFKGYEHYGAIKLFSHATLNATNCTFSGNTLSNNTQGWQGGADIWAGGAATVNLTGTSPSSVFLNGTTGGGATMTLDHSNVAQLNMDLGYNNAAVKVEKDSDSHITSVSAKEKIEDTAVQRYTANTDGSTTTYVPVTYTKVEAVAATCGTAGNSEYYIGSDGNYYEDAAGVTPIEENSWVINATGHTKVHHERVAATYNSTGTEEYWECSVCQKLFSDEEMTQEIQAPVEIPMLTGAVAQVGDVKYGTFAEAVTAANGSLIKILAKDATPYVMSVGQTIVTDNYTKITIVAPEGAYAINRAYNSTAKTYTFTVIDAVASMTTGGTTKYYASLNDAISAAPQAPTAATVNLLQNHTANSINVGSATAKKNVVIDLGGNTLTLTRNYSALFIVRNGSTAVVQNGTVVFNTVYTNASGFYMYDNATSLTLAADLDVVATGDTAGVYVKNGTFTSAADITAEDSFAIATNGSATSNATITVTGGTLTSDTVAVYLPGDADVTFTGGNVTGSTAVYIKSGDVTIAGGTFTANGAAADYTYSGNGVNATGDAIVVDSCGYPGGAPAVEITGNPTVTSDNGKQIGDYSYGNNALGEVTATSNTMTLPEGLKWKETETAGVYEVAPDYVAEVNGTGYMTFAEAVAARTSNNDVITLLKAAGTYTGANTEFPIKVAKNGKTVTVKVNGAYIVSSSTADGVTTYTVTEAAIEYTNLAGAVSYKSNIDYTNMSGSGTYKLLKDITCNSRIVPGIMASNVTIDLNGHTLTSTASDEAFLFSRTGSAASHNSYTITNGTINAASDGVALLASNADLTLDDVTINAAGNYGIVTNGTKTGNNITVTDSEITADVAGIYKPSNGALTLTDTSVEGDVAVYVKSGTVAINGGTFTGTGAKADYTYNGNGINPTGDAIVIDSCGYPGGAPSVSIGGNPTINSTNGVEIGDYAGNGVTELAPVTATDNSLTLPEGLKWVETATAGVYEVAPDYVAEVNGTGYMTFAEAVDARTSNDDVITLLKAAGTYTGANTEFPIKVAKNGKSVTVKVSGPYLVTNATSNDVTTYTVAEAAIEYTTLAGAVSYKSNIDYSNMSGSGTYKLLKDITCNSRIVPGIMASNVTIDLNGHTLTSTASDEAFLFSRAGSAASHNSYTITNGTIIAPGDGIQLLANYADLTLNGVTVNAAGDYGIVTNGTKTGNNITVTNSAITGDDAGIYKPSNGTLTLTNTSVEGNVAVYVKSGTVAINGGTFTGTGAKADYTYNGNGINPTGDAIVIDSCGYPGGAPSVSIGGNPTINSTNGVEIGDYAGNGVTELAAVTATDNSLTLPEGLAWIETATAGTYTVGKVVTGHTISLDGNIALNFYLNANISNIKNAVVNFTVDNDHYTGTATIDAEAEPERNRGYKVSFKVPAAYMAHQITATITLGNDVIATDTYSVEDYAFEILADQTQSAEVKTLVKEMLNYGAKAYDLFKSQAKTPVTYQTVTGYTMADVTAQMIADKIQVGGSDLKAVAANLGAKLYGTSVVYLSESTLRVIFAKSGGLTGYTSEQHNYYFLYDKADIPAAELDTQWSFTANGVEFKYSALDYAKSIVESDTTSAAQKELAKSLFLYNQAAKAYFATLGD